MHAVITSVTIKDREAAEKYLHEQVVPNVKQAPGFVAAYWVRDESQGRGTMVFESEEAATAAANGIRERIGGNPGVDIDSVTVGEVVASA